jgi:hypothetical protein
MVLALPILQWVPSILFTAVKRPERENDNSDTTSAEIKKTSIYTGTPHPNLFMAEATV